MGPQGETNNLNISQKITMSEGRSNTRLQNKTKNETELEQTLKITSEST